MILGDKWKAMKQEDRREYVIQAKLLADEHKRVNPDCWKRKRNSEVSTQTLLTSLLALCIYFLWLYFGEFKLSIARLRPGL